MFVFRMAAIGCTIKVKSQKILSLEPFLVDVWVGLPIKNGDLVHMVVWVWLNIRVPMDHMYVYIYTLWLLNIAMENGPFIDGSPIKNGDFPWLC